MFEGTAECDNAFNTLKERLRDTKLFSLYDPKKKTELVVDASPIGLGAILCQLKPSGTSSIIAFASKALTPTERRYSQTERQALSIIWGCEQFRLYLLGIPVTVWTDQKSLVPLFNNPNATLSARMERSMLRKQPFNITVQYLPGEWNAADFSSRHRDIDISGRRSEGLEKRIRILTGQSRLHSHRAKQRVPRRLARRDPFRLSRDWRDLTQRSSAAAPARL